MVHFTLLHCINCGLIKFHKTFKTKAKKIASFSKFEDLRVLDGERCPERGVVLGSRWREIGCRVNVIVEGRFMRGVVLGGNLCSWD